MSLTAREIIQQLMRERHRRHFVLPNYTPAGWWENDVFEVTDAGFWHEYEVKVSRSDFLADREKRKASWQWKVQNPGKPLPSKHGRLEAADPKGPNRFTFVVPAGLIQKEEVPEWAGLIEASPTKWKNRLSLVSKIQASRLHSGKIDPKIVAHARSVCYWRMHTYGRAIPHDPMFVDGEGI